MTLSTILAGLKAALPHLENDAATVAKVAAEVKAVAVDAGQWTESHEQELAAVQAAVPAVPTTPTPETA